MAPIGQTAFTALVWGAVALVLGIFAYVLSVVISETFGSSPEEEAKLGSPPEP